MTDLTHEINIPFAGFYNSFHSDTLDRELEYIADLFVESVGYDIPESLMNLFYDAADYETARLEYARAYTESFIAEYLTADCEFVIMESPRYYNFETDRLFIKVSRSEIARLWRETDRDIFERMCRDRHTSYDGFISSYSNNWQSWGKLSTWDHNQLGTLLRAYLETVRGESWDQWAEYSLVEDISCNGDVHLWLWGNEESARPWRIFNYLEERSRRVVKNMAQWRVAFAKPWGTTPLGATA